MTTPTPDTPGVAVVHVVPRNMRWEVEVGGVTRPMIDWLCTKERAVAHALDRAEELLEGGQPHAIVVIDQTDGGEEAMLVVR